MFEFLQKPYHLNDDIKHNLKKIFSIGLSIFLFILFFQPLTPDLSEFNTKLFFFTGYGAIAIIILVLFLVLLPAIFKPYFLSSRWNLGRDILVNFSIFIFISTAYSFYSYYIGGIFLSIPVLFRVVLLSLIPVVILIIINQFQLIRSYLQRALEYNKQYGKAPIPDLSVDEIKFFADGKSEPLRVLLNEIILIKSANNYIEVYCMQNNEVKKYLIRNTLNYAEHLLRDYKNIVKCHRSCVVNTSFIINLKTGQTGPKLKIKNIDEEIPVSRQYILKVKEIIMK